MTASATELLRAGQRGDGGWGATAGAAATTEATAYATMALHRAGPGHEAAVARGTGWLRARQRPDGSWPASDAVEGGSWMTSAAVIALHSPADRRAAVAGARWLLTQEGRLYGRLRELWLRFFPDEGAGNDFTLQGWPWAAGTTSWVEPTAAALVALKRVRDALPRRAAAERIGEAEAMLFDRVCTGGGWNYGNSRVLGEELWPYPDTTAWALLALQDHPRHPVVLESLEAQRRMLRENDSGLTVALSILAFRAHRQPVADLEDRLRRNVEATELLGEMRPLALAVLALDARPSPFHLGS